MAFLRPREKTSEKNGGEEAVRKTVEEILERRILPKVEALVARETSPDSSSMRKLGERIYGGLYEGLVLEKERMGLI